MRGQLVRLAARGLAVAALLSPGIGYAQAKDPCLTQNVDRLTGDLAPLNFQGVAQAGLGVTLSPAHGSSDLQAIVVGGGSLLEALNGAVMQMNNQCGGGESTPAFQVDENQQLPQDLPTDKRLTTIAVDYHLHDQPGGLGMEKGKNAEMQFLSSPGDTVPVATLVVAGLCPGKVPEHWPNGICSPADERMNWGHPYAQKILLHELFHALGVGHDRKKGGGCKSRRGLMRDDVHENATFEVSYCSYADHLNCDGSGCSDGLLCEPCPPDPSVDRSRPWDPLDLCALYPNLPECVVGGGTPAPPPFPNCEFRSECEVVTTCGEPGDEVPDGGLSLCVDDVFSPLSWCDFLPLEVAGGDQKGDCQTSRQNCEYFWTCHALPGGAFSSTESIVTQHDGPEVLLAYPSKDRIVSGIIPVGIAISEQDVEAVLLDVFVDHQRMPLIGRFEQTETIGVCGGTVGHTDPSCPYVGFGGQLDTGQLSDGFHTLQILAKREGNQGSFPTWLEVRIEVRNQSQPAEPMIVVAEGWGGHTRIPNDGTYSYSFGERALGTFPFVAPFLICNLGMDSLQLLNHSSMVSGEGFSRGFGGPAGTVAPQRCTQLDVRFDVDQPGTYSGTVSVASTDVHESPFEFAISGTAIDNAAGPMLVLREIENNAATGIEYVHGQTLELGATSPTIGSSQVLEIANDGSVPLNVTSVSVTGNCFWRSALDPQTIPPGGGVWFATTFYCDEDQPLGPYSGTLTIRSSDTDADPFTLSLHGDLVANPNPRLWVKRMSGGVPISTVHPGSTETTSTTSVGVPTSILFQIKNLSSSADLMIANPQSLVTGACFYQIGTPPDSVVAPGASTTFRVRLLCPTSGVKTGNVLIQSNDPNRPGPGTFPFVIEGTVNP